MHATLIAAAADTDHSGLLCTILLFATIIAFIIGLAQLLGLDFMNRVAGPTGRFGGIIVAIILIIAYALFC